MCEVKYTADVIGTGWHFASESELLYANEREKTYHAESISFQISRLNAHKYGGTHTVDGGGRAADPSA